MFENVHIYFTGLKRLKVLDCPHHCDRQPSCIDQLRVTFSTNAQDVTAKLSTCQKRHITQASYSSTFFPIDGEELRLVKQLLGRFNRAWLTEDRLLYAQYNHRRVFDDQGRYIGDSFSWIIAERLEDAVGYFRDSTGEIYYQYTHALILELRTWESWQWKITSHFPCDVGFKSTGHNEAYLFPIHALRRFRTNATATQAADLIFGTSRDS